MVSLLTSWWIQLERPIYALISLLLSMYLHAAINIYSVQYCNIIHDMIYNMYLDKYV